MDNLLKMRKMKAAHIAAPLFLPVFLNFPPIVSIFEASNRIILTFNNLAM